jgi:hypothetical protein
MNTPSLETLLEKLAKGESEAAERVYRDYEPLLRAMVRRRLTPMLRAKFDGRGLDHRSNSHRTECLAHDPADPLCLAQIGDPASDRIPGSTRMRSAAS